VTDHWKDKVQSKIGFALFFIRDFRKAFDICTIIQEKMNGWIVWKNRVEGKVAQ